MLHDWAPSPLVPPAKASAMSPTGHQVDGCQQAPITTQAVTESQHARVVDNPCECLRRTLGLGWMQDSAAALPVA